MPVKKKKAAAKSAKDATKGANGRKKNGKKLRCMHWDCRRLRTHGNYCLDHRVEEPEFVPSPEPQQAERPAPEIEAHGVEKMAITDIEAETWGRLDAEIRGLQNERQVIALQQKTEESELKIRMSQRVARMEAIEAELKDLKGRYEELVKELATRYGIPRAHMTLDADARIIRNVRSLDMAPRG